MNQIADYKKDEGKKEYILEEIKAEYNLKDDNNSESSSKTSHEKADKLMINLVTKYEQLAEFLYYLQYRHSLNFILGNHPINYAYYRPQNK